MGDVKAPPVRVVIMAGIQGSGKSTIALRDFPESSIISTDDFWTKDGQEYAFDASRLTEAHNWNLRRFVELLYSLTGSDPADRYIRRVVVDNTNTSIAEIAPYYAVAQAYGAEVEVWAVICPWQDAVKRQTHGVSESKVYQKSLRFEETLKSFPSWWNLRVIDNPSPVTFRVTQKAK